MEAQLRELHNQHTIIRLLVNPQTSAYARKISDSRVEPEKGVPELQISIKNV